MSHSASSAALAGVTLMVALTARPPSDPGTSRRATVAVRGPSVESGSPHAITASSTTPAASAARRSARSGGNGRGRTSAAPTKPPTAPPATAATKPAMAASGSSADGHGIGIHTCDQPHSAPRPTVPISDARQRARRHRPEPGGRAGTQLHEQRLDDVEREVRSGLAEDDPYGQREEAADHEEAGHGQERAAAPEVQAGGDQADTGGEHDQGRVKHQPELGHAEVELALEGGERDQEPADQERPPDPEDQRRLGGRVLAALGGQRLRW